MHYNLLGKRHLMRKPDKLVEDYLGDWRAGWSMGSFGAIAEFHRDQNEPTEVKLEERVSVGTDRGGIAFQRAALNLVVPVAYETLSPKRHRWAHGVALCLPEAAAKREARTSLTEIGPDEDAIRPADREGVLFDLGLSQTQSDFCIRTSEPDLLGALRANLGRSLFEPGNTALGALLSAHPHRVVLTNIGRAEVYQKIGGPETGGVSPEGPHTHLLPKLLKSGRTHSANAPIPSGLVPVGSLHPGNPVMTPAGNDQLFDADLHAAFQSLLAMFGIPPMVAAKAKVLNAIAGEAPAQAFDLPSDRFSRSAVRLALRQQARMAEDLRDTALQQRIAAWRSIHDPASDDTEDDDAPGH
jgi:hypothetical protein